MTVPAMKNLKVDVIHRRRKRSGTGSGQVVFSTCFILLDPTDKQYFFYNTDNDWKNYLFQVRT
jgi:hypothetical protein